MQTAERTLTLSGKQARYYDFSNLNDANVQPTETKPIAHFYGGNGFAVGVYEPLIRALSQHFQVISLAMQGYWHDLPTAKVLTRQQDADNLIAFLEQTQDGPVIGIGHSQGATATAMAAAKRPDLFSALYLLDPVTFTKAQKTIYGLIPRAIVMTQEPFKSTLVKQADWDSVDAYYQYLRQHRAFKRISDDHLKTFAQNSLVQHQVGGFRLLFQPEQELASYFGTPYIDAALKTLNKTAVPYHIILGKPSVFNSEKVRQNWRHFVPSDSVTELADYGHLLPMEAPQTCADIILQQQQTYQ